MGENSSYFNELGQDHSICDFKLDWVVLHSSVKEFFKTIYYQEQNTDALLIESI